MCKWAVTIEIWPHSTGRGQSIDQKEAGERVHTLTVEADDIHRALKAVKLFTDGIETNPMVWQAPIMKIERAGHA